MGSITGLKKGNFTSIDNSGEIRLGAEINPGTAGQALVSGGADEPARWDTHTGTIQPLTMGTNLSLASGNPSFNGGVADTINATDTNTQLNLTAALPVVINNLGGLDREVELQYDTNTLGAGGGALEVLKVPNDLTAGTNISFSSGTTYNGSSAITISSTDTNTTYTGGKNITVDTTPNPDEIDLDDDLTDIDSITFTSGGGSTALTGNDYPSNPTPMTYFDLSSSTNIIPGGVLATKVQRSYLFKSFSNVYSEYSSNFRTSFVAQSTNVMVEFRAIVRADNKVFYGGLYDYNAGSYNADTRNRFNYNDESDQDFTVITWWMRNLTAGTTYYISPYFRGSSSTVYIYAGHGGTTDGFAPAIMRIIDGGNNVTIY